MPRFVTSLFLSALATQAFCQTDNFDDGDDVGWTHTDPLTEAGAPAGSFTFPTQGGGKAYRTKQDASPSPEELGNSRVGSYRADVSYTDFHVTVDIVGFDDAIDQDIGILARMADVGLGTTTGYAVTYDTSEDAIYFALIDGEAATIIGNTPLGLLDPAVGFRLELQGIGEDFIARAYEFDDLEEPIAELEAFDDVFESGFCGFFVVTASGEDSADATFDNYSAKDPNARGPVTPLEILSADRVGGDTFRVDFSADHEQVYSLESSTDLIQWVEVTDTHQEVDTTTGRFEIPINAEVEAQYFRVNL